MTAEVVRHGNPLGWITVENGHVTLYPNASSDDSRHFALQMMLRVTDFGLRCRNEKELRKLIDEDVHIREVSAAPSGLMAFDDNGSVI